MMQVLPKWQVFYQFPDREVTLWLYGNFISDVLKRAGEIQFSENGLEQPREIRVTRVLEMAPSNVTLTQAYSGPR